MGIQNILSLLVVSKRSSKNPEFFLSVHSSLNRFLSPAEIFVDIVTEASPVHSVNSLLVDAFDLIP